MRLLKLFTIVLLLISGVMPEAWAAYQLNMPVGVTPISHDIYALHMIAFWVSVGICTIVFSIMIYALIMHRKSRGVTPADFHEHPVLEIVWAVIPLLILIALAVPATLVLMKSQNTGNADLSIKITGYQWKWKYEYLNKGISFYSNLATPLEQLHNQAPKGEHYLLEVDNPVVVPTHKKIRFLVTANDVLHSWWVPQLGIKQDAIPGFIHESWAEIDKPGTYRGQCAELCGAGHGFMPIVVVAMDQADFDHWVTEKSAGKVTGSTQIIHKQWTLAESMARGESVYNTSCAICHKADGTGQPPTYPAIKDSKVVLGPIAGHIDIVLNGKSGTAMQAFAGQLSDEDIAAVVTYQRNAFGNKTGDLVQPDAVTKQRK